MGYQDDSQTTSETETAITEHRDGARTTMCRHRHASAVVDERAVVRLDARALELEVLCLWRHRTGRQRAFAAIAACRDAGRSHGHRKHLHNTCDRPTEIQTSPVNGVYTVTTTSAAQRRADSWSPDCQPRCTASPRSSTRTTSHAHTKAHAFALLLVAVPGTRSAAGRD